MIASRDERQYETLLRLAQADKFDEMERKNKKQNGQQIPYGLFVVHYLSLNHRKRRL